MVSLAETHLKLLFSADTEERELQGFTLVQLLLVSTAIEPCCNLWTPHCNRQFSLSLGKKSPHILSKFNPLDMYTLLIQTLSMAPSVSLLTGFDSTKNNNCLDICERKEKKVSNRYCKHGFMSRAITCFAWKYYGSTVLCEQCQSVQSNFSPG